MTSEAPNRADDVSDITFRSPYAHLGVGESVPLYTGPMEITASGLTVTGEGELKLILKGDPHIEFKLSSKSRGFPVMANEPRPSFTLPALGSSCTSIIQGVTTAFGRTQAPLQVNGFLDGEGIEVCKRNADGKPESLGRVLFHLLNFPDFSGTNLYEVARADQQEGVNYPYRGRVRFGFGKWAVTLDKRRDLTERMEAAHAEHGYTFTHTGTLTRADGKLFSPEDAKKALDMLSWFFSLARGARCACVLPAGYRHLDEPLWRLWQSPFTAPARACETWLSERTPQACFSAAAAFAECWRSEARRKWLRLGIGLYCVSNQSGRGSIELQLAESQIALELLTCVAFLEENTLMSEKAFEGLSAADKVRVLLFWLGVPATVPDKYAALKAREAGADAPEVVTEIRNAIIHPTRSNRAKREKIDMKAVYEAWQLNMWYVELALLKLIGYSGPYSNRTISQIAGAVETLPWTPKAQA